MYPGKAVGEAVGASALTVSVKAPKTADKFKSGNQRVVEKEDQCQIPKLSIDSDIMFSSDSSNKSSNTPVKSVRFAEEDPLVSEEREIVSSIANAVASKVKSKPGSHVQINTSVPSGVKAETEKSDTVMETEQEESKLDPYDSESTFLLNRDCMPSVCEFDLSRLKDSDQERQVSSSSIFRESSSLMKAQANIKRCIKSSEDLTYLEPK